MALEKILSRINVDLKKLTGKQFPGIHNHTTRRVLLHMAAISCMAIVANVILYIAIVTYPDETITTCNIKEEYAIDQGKDVMLVLDNCTAPGTRFIVGYVHTALGQELYDLPNGYCVVGTALNASHHHPGEPCRIDVVLDSISRGFAHLIPSTRVLDPSMFPPFSFAVTFAIFAVGIITAPCFHQCFALPKDDVVYETDDDIPDTLP